MSQILTDLKKVLCLNKKIILEKNNTAHRKRFTVYFLKFFSALKLSVKLNVLGQSASLHLHPSTSPKDQSMGLYLSANLPPWFYSI